MSWKKLHGELGAAASELHRVADALINELEGNPLVDEDSAQGDNAAAALHHARQWRALVEGAQID